MADEEKKEVDETWIFLNSPVFLLLLGTGILIGLYYLISPYQDCLRVVQQEKQSTELGHKDFCWERTNW